MVTRLGILRDCCKARFLDIKLPTPKEIGNGRYEPIVLTDKLLKEWDEKATEVVEVEAINSSKELSDGTIIGHVGIFVLAKPEGEEVGFYAVKKGTVITEGKAYIEYVNTAGVKALTFLFADQADGIRTLSNSPLKDENIFNLAGQRIQKMQKGINIVGGKKIVVK